MSRKKLPIGIQTFAKIRSDDYYYVDKTGFAQRLVDGGKAYFLSRPRRFGKSLFIDTLAEMFAGNKALFEGLACYDTWDWDMVYPVVRISFGAGRVCDPDELAQRIRDQLQANAARLGLDPLREKYVSGMFVDLIQGAEQLHGQRVVVLVDEYDKPILDNLNDTETALTMRDGLRDLYSVVKDQDAHIKFVFLTGVSKFSKVSIFSGLNNLNDITIDRRYSALCGYTEHDVDTVFAAELAGLDRDRIRNWYNGYNWTGVAVYNPFDLLLLFDKRQFRPYWFETGTPTFLIDTLTRRGFFLPDLEALTASESLLSTFDVGDLTTEALLFQTGYLTIAAWQDIGEDIYYTLGYPNREVRSALTSALLDRLTGDPRGAVEKRRDIYLALTAGDLGALEKLFTALFAGIPSDWHRKNHIADYEGYYASVFYACIAASGLAAWPEDSSSHGRVDLTVRLPGHIYLFEFKVVACVPDGGALAQIRAAGYADKYRADGTPIHLVGVEFSRERRSIVGFDTQTIP